VAPGLAGGAVDLQRIEAKRAELAVHRVDLAELMQLLDQRARGSIIRFRDHRVKPLPVRFRSRRRCETSSLGVKAVGPVEVQDSAVYEAQRLEGDHQLEQRPRVRRHEPQQSVSPSRHDVITCCQGRIVLPSLHRQLPACGAGERAAIPAIDVPADVPHRRRGQDHVDRSNYAVRIVA